MDPSRIYKFFQNKTKQYFWRRKHTCTKYSMLHVPRGKRTFRVLDGSVQTSGLFIRDLHPDFYKAFWVKWNRIKIKLTINGSFKMSFFFFMLYCFFTTTELAFTPKRVSPRLPDVCLFIYIQSHVSGGVLCSNAWLTLSNRGCVRSVNPPPRTQMQPIWNPLLSELHNTVGSIISFWGLYLMRSIHQLWPCAWRQRDFVEGRGIRSR